MTGDDWRVEVATADDEQAVRRVLDAAMLSLDGIAVDERIAAGDVLVAVAGGADDRRALGACVLVPGAERRDADRRGEGGGTHLAAIAVRRTRRGGGIGRALVERASERAGRLTAAFDPSVRPFYESLGFSIAAEEGDGRLWGVLER